MRGNTGGVRGSWATAVLVAGSLLTGCAGGGSGAAAKGTDGASPRRTGSPTISASPEATATTPGGSNSASASASVPGAPAAPDPALVPKTAKDGRELVDSVVLAPGDWGRGFVAQNPAAGKQGTWAVLDDSCRWQREKLPRGVLASASRYSRLPGGAGRSAVKVTAAVTAHASVLGADDQLSTTLEEVLRCPDQQPRTDERITGLMSVGTPFGAREQQYADDSVYELGSSVEQGGAAESYRWMVARLGTVVAAVSVTGGEGHTPAELDKVGADALAQMLTRVQQRLKGK
ncbi:hypothetical protein OG562_04515 [Streptomyces sp. NBC_01275]|uniref:hypothetical protein n=1 Tax=Streptomyces sp. NBC_01275 TaxID=2903807 RepID=UPI00225992FF|nr:hypothetical protein [Streptomyces sp. NBC_01275]MCX4760254.1 hypothetical protein [Streptomyces sp. NBC_01275]